MSYQPRFEGPIQGWTVNYCRKHAWKTEGSQQWDDLMQEAYLVFLRCVERYPDVEEAPHFMALYKRAWANEMTDLANKDTALRQEVPFPTTIVDGDVIELEVMGEHYHDGNLATLLRQAPKEVLMVLNLFLNAPNEIVELALSGWRGRDKRCRAGGSRKICQLLGLPLDLDVLAMVEDHFSQS